MGGGVAGGIIGILLGAVLIYSGIAKRGRTDPSVTVTNNEGQSASMDSEGGKWVLIIIGIVLIVGGIVALVASAK